MKRRTSQKQFESCAKARDAKAQKALKRGIVPKRVKGPRSKKQLEALAKARAVKLQKAWEHGGALKRFEELVELDKKTPKAKMVGRVLPWRGE